tara:strand:- start:857 stop:1312 length:456 start_codon:yes stop_codon:yes gene_type:complete
MENVIKILVNNADEVFELENSDIFDLLDPIDPADGIAYCKLKSFPLISKERLEELEQFEEFVKAYNKDQSEWDSYKKKVSNDFCKYMKDNPELLNATVKKYPDAFEIDIETKITDWRQDEIDEFADFNLSGIKKVKLKPGKVIPISKEEKA